MPGRLGACLLHATISARYVIPNAVKGLCSQAQRPLKQMGALRLPQHGQHTGRNPDPSAPPQNDSPPGQEHSARVFASSESPLARSLRALIRNQMAMAGAAVIIIWIIVAIAAPLIAPYDALAQKIEDRLSPPSLQHLFGTDELGRDVFSRVVYGARISLPVGLVVILFSMLMGAFVGALAGYLAGIFDLLVMRVADITLAFPSIVLALAIASVLGPSLKNAVIAMILVWWPEYARLMRGQVLSVKHNDYVMAAQAIGVPQKRILSHHILPNSFAPVVIKASLDTGSAILNIAALSFIGLGAVPPTPEWGAMISLGRYKFYHWWLTTFPGLAVLSVVLGFNFLGDGLRDAFDPWLRGA